MKKKLFAILLFMVLVTSLTGCGKKDNPNDKENDNSNNYELAKVSLPVSYTKKTLHYEICDKNGNCQTDYAGLETNLIDYYNVDLDFLIGLQEKYNSNFKFYIDITFSASENTKNFSTKKTNKDYYAKVINLYDGDITDITDDFEIRIKNSFKIDYSKYYNEIIEYLNNNGISEDDVKIYSSVFLTIRNSNSDYYTLDVISTISENYDGLSNNPITGFYLFYPNGKLMMYNQNNCNNQNNLSCTCSDVDNIINLLLKGEKVKVDSNMDIKISSDERIQNYNSEYPYATEYTVSCGTYSKSVRISHK